jgi:hypothetical protein
LAEALLSWNSLFRYLSPAGAICYLRLYDLWGWTLWWSSKFAGPDDGAGQFRSFLLLLWTNDALTEYTQLVTLSLNILLCYDLVITLGSPFEVAGKRITYYEVSAAAFSAALTVYLWLKEDLEQYRKVQLSKTNF